LSSKHEQEEKAAKQISDAVNAMSLDSKVVAELLAHTHPTLQQDFMRVCLSFIKVMSEKTTGIDLRNQDSVNVAKKIASKIDYEDFFLARI